MKPIYFILLFVFITSCEANETIEIDPDNLLIGNWANPEYENETATFQRVSALGQDSYGISFKEEATFTERTSGWCGTPPLTFFDIEGNWSLDGEIILVNTPNYHPVGFQWRIISLNENQLIVKRVLSEQEKDHRALMNLFDEFSSIAAATPCSDPKDWSIAAYGSKACGGPKGCIAYSNQIDTVHFLKLVKDYTDMEHEYTIKWDIVSDCSVTPKPTSLECKNGFVSFNY